MGFNSGFKGLMFHSSGKVCTGILHSVLCLTATVYLEWPSTRASGAALCESDRTVATLFSACENAASTFCYYFAGILHESHYGNLVIPGVLYLSYTGMLEDLTHETL